MFYQLAQMMVYFLVVQVDRIWSFLVKLDEDEAS